MGADGPTPVTIGIRRLAIATIAAGRGRRAELARQLEAAHGLTLPEPGKAAMGQGDVTAYPIAPDTWLITGPAAETGFITGLIGAARGAAAVVDQSHGKAALRVSGPRVRDALDKVCRLDLHPRVFPPLACGVTPIAHVAVLIARADDGHATPAFDLIAPATFAIHVLEAIEIAALEFGVVRN
jgi:sarcosine oxidase subunit gamma